MRQLLIFINIGLALMSCQRSMNNNAWNGIDTCKSEVKYAKGFKIRHFKEFTVIDVKNPWDTTKISDTYVLVKKSKHIPKHIPHGTLVRTPVERVGITTSVFAGLYQMLQSLDKIVAVTEPQYIYIPSIHKSLNEGKITDLGLSFNLNNEKIITSKLNLLIVSAFKENNYDIIKKYNTVIVNDASYMESTPLGRTEWIKLHAAFLDKDSIAYNTFDSIESRYKTLVDKVQKVKFRPTVFTEKKTGDLWYVAGGESYMGNFIKDAGGKYIWEDLKISGAVSYSIEKVYQKVLHADFWLIKYNNKSSDLSYKNLAEELYLYQNLSAFKTRRIFTSNLAKKHWYEVGQLEPDVVLSDFISIFHPELLPDHKLKYYDKIK